MERLVGVGVAECRFHFTAVGCAGTVPLADTINAWKSRHACGKTHQCSPYDAHGNTGWYFDPEAQLNANGNAKTNRDSSPNPGANANAGSSPNPGSHATNFQSCLYDRDGKRGVEQPHW